MIAPRAHCRVAYPLEVRRDLDPKDVIRFLKKVDTLNGHWFWNGYIDSKGYGRFRYRGEMHGAHRIAYAIFNGDLPEGMTVHHTCHETHCVNPEHLELATLAENTRERNTRAEMRKPVVIDENDPSDIPF